MATHSSVLAWRISWTEEPGELQSMGLQSRTQLSDQHLVTFKHLPRATIGWKGALMTNQCPKVWMLVALGRVSAGSQHGSSHP